MDEIIKYATIGLMAVGYFWIIAKSVEWFLSLIFRKAFKRKEKDRKQAAINELYDAYELGDMKPGDDLKITTKGGLVVFMYRRPEE
ncbi:DUF4752 family protein [Morganella morganii]|uniref:DUF4752 family protein n=1 Tax=Morganella morganii TaxID=582 RepID=UPI000BBCFCF5|nr:DUF4752 family protein [Morganella morganii]ATF52621.1 DUF4752 domain-containing protein [Morganella morganii]EKU4000813.1 DUF4752 family protein [Morganella morganii]EMD0828888.1 DUF4752 family protein [Morganella morganii]MBT0405125.1 DUF4752 family protein [Morganella morganii subsp. morganii]MBT0437207.1 DUF4752 family protein [Morganella morganii subsp. morganii]